MTLERWCHQTCVNKRNYITQLKLASSKIWLASCAVDFRLDVDGLIEVVQSHFQMDAREG